MKANNTLDLGLRAHGGKKESHAAFYSWMDRHGHVTQAPTQAEKSAAKKRLLTLEINPGQNLGLMIRGGAEYGLGIFVTGVDPGSVAHRAGLQVKRKNFIYII